MRQSWTDDRLDALNEKVDRRFEEVDRRFGAVDRRLDNVEGEVKDMRREMTAGFDLLHARFDSMQQTIMAIGGVVIAALLGIIATQI